MSGATIGIDLGTTSSVVAIARDGRVELTDDGAGHRLQPSVVSFALAEAGVMPGHVDDIILVGGATRVPLVRRRIAEHEIDVLIEKNEAIPAANTPVGTLRLSRLRPARRGDVTIVGERA